jgi:hypothetical protein
MLGGPNIADNIGNGAHNSQNTRSSGTTMPDASQGGSFEELWSLNEIAAGGEKASDAGKSAEIFGYELAAEACRKDGR